MSKTGKLVSKHCAAASCEESCAVLFMNDPYRNQQSRSSTGIHN